MATTTRKVFAGQAVRLYVRNAEGTALDEVRFRADIAARLDIGIPSACIPDRWKASVKHEGRTFVVALYDESGEWFASDILDADDEDPADA